MTIELGAHVSAAGGVDLARVGRFHANQEQYKIKHLVAHDSYLINIASPNPELREKSRHALAHELERCDTLGIHYLVSHPGAHMGEGPEAGIERVAESINQIYDEMSDGKAKILIETTAGQGTA